MTSDFIALIFASKIRIMKRNLLTCLFFLLFISTAKAQIPDSLYRKCFVGSTLFMLFNLAPDPPEYYQLNFGYRVTPKDVFSLELITWTYKGPVGRTYGPDFGNAASDFPGKVRAFGAGIAYKRFLWKSMYTQIHSTAFKQNYLDESGDKIQRGFQLFNTVRLGYQFRFFKNQFFLEPSVAITFWPVNTNLPDAFQVEEDKWNNYFIGEPGLHFGFNF